MGSTGSIAFLIGTPPNRQVAIASARDGRIIRRIALDTVHINSIALSPDARTIYYASGGTVRSLPTEGAGKPTRLSRETS
jgi:hypothetical protein